MKKAIVLLFTFSNLAGSAQIDSKLLEGSWSFKGIYDQRDSLRESPPADLLIVLRSNGRFEFGKDTTLVSGLWLLKDSMMTLMPTNTGKIREKTEKVFIHSLSENELIFKENEEDSGERAKLVRRR